MKLKYFLTLFVIFASNNLWARTGSEGGGGFADWETYFQCEGQTDEGRVLVDITRMFSNRVGQLKVFKDPQNEKPLDQINFANDLTNSQRPSDMVCEPSGSVEHNAVTVKLLTTSQLLWNCSVPDATSESRALLIELNVDAITKSVTGIVFEGTKQEKRQIGVLHSCQ